MNDALFEAISSSRVLDADHIERLASAHHVCPYELQRDAARWADVIVCDYHYAFAPAASLFGLPDDPDDGDVVFLVDGAHNLVDRMREMYSAELTLASLRELDRLVGRTASFGPLSKTLRTAIAAFPTWERALPASAQTGSHGNRYQPTYRVVSLSTAFTESLAQLSKDIESTLAQFVPSTDGNGQPSGQPTGHAIEPFLAMRDTNQALRAFLGALQRSETGYVSFLDRTRGANGKVEIFCVDPRHDLEERLEQARAAVFFSGALLPLDYHRKLLAAQDGDPSLYVRSGFDPSHLQVLVAADASARFSNRGPELYTLIAAYLVSLTRTRPGNYLVFLPSYAMLDEAEAALRTHAGK